MWLCRLLDNSHTYDAHSPHTFANQNGVCTFTYKIGKGEGGGTVALCLGWLAQHSNLPFLNIKSLVTNKMRKIRKRERENVRECNNLFIQSLSFLKNCFPPYINSHFLSLFLPLYCRFSLCKMLVFWPMCVCVWSMQMYISAQIFAAADPFLPPPSPSCSLPNPTLQIHPLF